MNTNKMVLIIIGGIVVFLLALMILNLDSPEKTVGKKVVPEFKVWIIGDEGKSFSNVLDKFKTLSGNNGTTFIVESFPDYEEYYYALTSAIFLGKAPDMFVLNNNEQSVFQEQTIGISSSIINSSDFRKKYKIVFGEDLIMKIKDGNKEIEFLKGIPIGYETLGIFYNRKNNIKSSDLSSLSSLSNTISKLRDKYPKSTPIGMGNGTTVYNSSDIMTQFFLLENGVSGIDTLSEKSMKGGLSSYMFFGDKFGDNKYNSSFDKLKISGENNLDLFTAGKTLMVVGYPRMINAIDKKGYGKAYLDAVIFPHSSSAKGKTLVNYNYFVINKDSENIDLGLELLKYMTSEDGSKEYLKEFPYYLPAMLSLEEELLEEKINPKYNILLKDFYNFDFELSSFDKGVKNIYDKKIVNILDDTTNYISEYKKLNDSLKCKRDKFLTLEKLSIPCE